MTNRTVAPRPVALPPPRPSSRHFAVPRPVPGASANASFLLRFVLVALAAVAAVALIASAPATVLVPILTVLGAGALTTAFIVLADRWLSRRGRNGDDARPWSRRSAPRWRQRPRGLGRAPVPMPTRYFRSIPFNPEAR